MNVPKIMCGVGNALTAAASKATSVTDSSVKVIDEMQSFKLLNGTDNVQSSFMTTDALTNYIQGKAKKVIAYVRGLCDKAEKALGLVNSTCSKVTNGVKSYFKKQPSFKAHQA